MKTSIFSLFYIGLGSLLLNNCGGQPISNKLTFLGTASNVSFYTGDTQMDWFDSKRLCEENGLELAAIKTDTQTKLLRLANRSEHWTSARESRLPTMYIWDDGSEEHPSPDVFEAFNLNGTISNRYSFCGAIVVLSDIEFRTYLCDRPYVNPLCQERL